MEALSVDAGTPPRRAAGKRVLLAVCAACLLGAAACKVDMQEVDEVLGGLEAAAKTYAQSPETVKAMLAESPRVRQMAQESPQIAKMLEDPKQIALMVKYLRELHASARMMHQQMASRKGVQKLQVQVESLVQEVREVLAEAWSSRRYFTMRAICLGSSSIFAICGDSWAIWRTRGLSASMALTVSGLCAYVFAAASRPPSTSSTSCMSTLHAAQPTAGWNTKNAAPSRHAAHTASSTRLPAARRGGVPASTESASMLRCVGIVDEVTRSGALS